MRYNKIIIFIAFSTAMMIFVNSCSQIRNVAQTLTNLQRLQFKLQSVDQFKLAGVGFSGKSSLSDFGISDGLNLAQAFSSKSLPTEFVLNVAAKNPNDGTGGNPQTVATLTGLDWRLYIDDVQTIAGNISSPIDIPGTGQTAIIPLRISLDLVKFFENRGYNGIINLALAIGGYKGSPAKLKLDAQPTVSTPFGPIVYPGRITIIDRQFN